MSAIRELGNLMVSGGTETDGDDVLRMFIRTAMMESAWVFFDVRNTRTGVAVPPRMWPSVIEVRTDPVWLCSSKEIRSRLNRLRLKHGLPPVTQKALAAKLDAATARNTLMRDLREKSERVQKVCSDFKAMQVQIRSLRIPLLDVVQKLGMVSDYTDLRKAIASRFDRQRVETEWG